MPDSEYDIAIVGGGAAGLTAGLYAARSRRSTLLFERKGPGGQIATTDRVENYPGFQDGIDGYDLAMAMFEQATKYGLQTQYLDVTALEREDDGRYRLRAGDSDYTARAVILSGGADYNHLNIPNEERLTGHGVSYCATCDAAFFAGQVAVVVGGGDSAMEEAVFLTRYATKVWVIHRSDKLRASKIMQERAFKEGKIEFIWDTVVDEVLGDSKVTGVRIRGVNTKEQRVLTVDCLFVAIGQVPNSAFLRDVIPLDEGGHICVNEWMETELPGVFGAGDARWHSARQLVAAAGDGCTAAVAAERYLSEHFCEP